MQVSVYRMGKYAKSEYILGDAENPVTVAGVEILTDEGRFIITHPIAADGGLRVGCDLQLEIAPRGSNCIYLRCADKR